MKIRHVIIILSVLVPVSMLFILFSNKGKFELKKDEKKADNKKYVQAMIADNDSTEVFIEGQGRISSARKVDASAEVQGALLQGGKPLKPGVSFSQGEVLFSVRDTEARLALQARKSSYLNLLANILPDLKLDFADNFEAWKNFFTEIDIAKPLPVIPQPKSAKEKTFIASKNIFGEYFNIKADEERLRKYAFVAPFSGSITEVFIEPGSIVNPGSRICTIIQSNDLEIEIPIDARNIGWLKTGAEVELIPTSGPKRFSGKVVRIGDYINPNSQSVPVFVSIQKKKDDILYNGMYLTARIYGGSIANTVEIPRRALLDENHCFIVKDSSLKSLDLEIKYVTSTTAIVSGIPDKSVVVTEPVTRFSDSLKIAPIIKK